MMKELNLIRWINKLEAHYRMYVSIGIALLVFVIASTHYSYPTYIIATWLAFALSNLLFSWVTILTSHPLEVRKIAKIQDTSRTLIFLIVIIACIVSLFAVILILKSQRDHFSSGMSFQLFASVASVICAWWLVHTTFTFRYAHLYYNLQPHSTDKKEFIRGLEFPKELMPDYLDFTYFSFVIGMTFQVSDVEISSRSIRRLALMHAVVSFIFNTVILALSINIILGIFQT